MIGIILALIFTALSCLPCHPASSPPICDPLYAASPAVLLPDMTVQVDAAEERSRAPEGHCCSSPL